MERGLACRCSNRNQFKHNMESPEKEIYDAPAVVIVEAQTEGIVCASGGDYDPFNNNGGNEQHSW